MGLVQAIPAFVLLDEIAPGRDRPVLRFVVVQQGGRIGVAQIDISGDWPTDRLPPERFRSESFEDDVGGGFY
jgi:hypothetical protein